MKIELLLLSSIFFINCAYIHPPITVESVNKEEKVNTKSLIDDLVKNAEEENKPIVGSVSVLPFEDTGYLTGLGLAATEFFTSNLSLFSQFTLIDRSTTNTLATELNHYSPEKKKQALRTEQLVQGEVNMKGKIVEMSGNIISNEKSDKLNKKSGNTEQFFQMVADLNIQFFEKNGITVSDEIANQLYEVPTENIRAYIHYSEGRYQESLGNYKAAVKSYQQAVELDPEFAEPEERLEKAKNLEASIGQSEVLEEVLAEPIVMQPTLEERVVPMPAATYKVQINFELP